MGAEVLVILVIAAMCATVAGFMVFKKERGLAILAAVLCVAAVILAIGLQITDDSRAAENARVTTEIETRYDKVHVVKLSAWAKTVRYTVSDKVNKVCDGKLVHYNGDWLIEGNPTCTVLPNR